jgi:hypothetical protein
MIKTLMKVISENHNMGCYKHIIASQDRDLSEVAGQWTYAGNRRKTKKKLST